MKLGSYKRLKSLESVQSSKQTIHRQHEKAEVKAIWPTATFSPANTLEVRPAARASMSRLGLAKLRSQIWR